MEADRTITEAGLITEKIFISRSFCNIDFFLLQVSSSSREIDISEVHMYI